MAFVADNAASSGRFVPDAPTPKFTPDSPLASAKSRFVPDNEPEKPTASGLPHWAVDASKSVIDTAAAIPRNVAAVGDMALGLPAMVAKMGQAGITDVVAAAHGDQHPMQASNEATEADWADEHFLQAPLQTMFGYDPEKTVVGHLMGKFGKAVDTAVENETKRTGDPERGALLRQVSNIVMMKAGDIMIGGVKGVNKGVKAIARKRMAETTPTGATPAPEWVTTAGKSASTPVDRPEIVGAKARKSSLAEGEYISSPDEGDLGPLPPIEAYEPSAEAHQHIHEALADPDLHTGHPEAVEAAQDVAAEKVHRAVNDDRAAQAAAKVSADPTVEPTAKLTAALIGPKLAGKLHNYYANSALKDIIDVFKPSIDPIRQKGAEVFNVMDANFKAREREVGSVYQGYIKDVPSKARREVLNMKAQRGDFTDLSETELYYVKRAMAELAKTGTMAQQTGVIQHLIDKYAAPIIWDFSDKSTKSYFDKALASGAGEGSKAGTFTPHALKRSLTLDEGLALKLKPKTLDHAELLGMYHASVIKAIENAQALYTLKSMKLGNGHYAVEPVGGDMPKDYVTDHRIVGLEGFGVHPEMVDVLRIGFDSYEPGAVQRAMLAAAFTAKRLTVSYSPFHLFSLSVAYTGRGGNVIDFAIGAMTRGAEKLTGQEKYAFAYKSGVDKAIEEYHKNGHGDLTDFAIRSGRMSLKSSMEDTVGRETYNKIIGSVDKWIGITGVSTVAGAWYAAEDEKLKGAAEGLGIGLGLSALGRGLGKVGKLPKLTEALDKPLTSADKAMHEFVFGYAQTGFKLETFGRIFERELADPKTANMDVNQIAANVGRMTDNIYGSLNWREVIEGMRSKFGRSVAGATHSKFGRNMQQLATFAPDWLMSTVRSWTQAVPGLAENAHIGKLHREYIAKSLIYTLTITDALNLYYSGHHVWENDFRSQRKQDADPDDNDYGLAEKIADMTFIDMGDGTKIEGNKHLFETVHLMSSAAQGPLFIPTKFAAGKLSSLVTDPINLMQNKQWLSPTWAPNITEGGTTMQKQGDYLKWMLQHHLPISAQQANEGKWAGLAGFPQHGMSDDEIEKKKQEIRDLKKERGLK